MSKIRSRGNRSTEKRLRACFISRGIKGWSVQAEDVLGKPDFIFPSVRLAIFVDGCFWHGCPRCARPPHSNKKYWREKVARNRIRDKQVSGSLRHAGWHVMRMWEHEVQRSSELIVGRVLHALRVAATRFEAGSKPERQSKRSVVSYSTNVCHDLLIAAEPRRQYGARRHSPR
jgi:DNA mismatch endonuclease (patch repair protein)